MLSLVASQRPVHEVQIQVFCLKIFDSLLTCFPNPAMVGVVQLACDPQIFPGDLAFLVDVCECLTHHILVAISRRTVDVPACTNDPGEA